MKRVSIVSERNEENNTYEIKTIVIFDDNSAPKIINYEGAQDLISVVSFAEKNGCNLLGPEGIRPALEKGLLQVISKANEKKMAELKAEILQEQLKYAPKEKTEQQKMEEDVNKEVQSVKKPQDEKKEETAAKKKKKIKLPEEFRNLAEYLRIDLEMSKMISDERIVGLERARENVIIARHTLNEITDKESPEAKLAMRNLNDRKAEYEKLHAKYRAELAEAMKKAKENNEQLPKEFKDLTKYFRLDMLRAKLDSDERIAGLERAKVNIIIAKKKLDSINNPNSPEAQLAKRELDDRIAEYEKLHAKYRAELAEAAKKAEAEEEENKHRLDLSEEDREFAEYLKLNILRAKKTIKPEGLARIKELQAKNERVAGLEKARDNVMQAIEKWFSFSDLSSPAAILAKREVQDREDEYNRLHAKYRAELAEAIKKAKVVEDKAKTLTKENKEVTNVPTKTTDEGVKKVVVPPVTRPAAPEQTKKAGTPEQTGPEFRREVVRPVQKPTDNKGKNGEPTGKDAAKTAAVSREKQNVPTNPFPNRTKVTRPATQVTDDKTKKETAKPVQPVQQNNPPKKDDQAKKTQQGAQVTPVPVPPVTPPKKNGTTDTQKTAPVQPVQQNNPPKKDNGTNKTQTGAPVPPTGTVNNNDTKGQNAVLVKDGKAKQAKGVNPQPNGTSNVQVNNGNGNNTTVKVKKTGKFDRFLKRVVSILVGAASVIGSIVGINYLIDKHNAKKQATQTPVAPPVTPPTVTEKPAEVTNQTVVNNTVSIVNPTLLAYFNDNNVPQNTRAFFQRPEVMQFLSQYKNEAQLREVISALAYGFESNQLTTKDGNFRLNADGQNYLATFTHDFLCAKTVVNRYSSREMMTVFGGTNISYEELMNGFKNYCYTITTYGMNATEPLPFHYLTNGNAISTRVLNELQEKLIVVNTNRANGTLTSEHTDDFIATVFKTYVQNDGSLNMSEGAKTVGAALVDSFVAMQSQVSNGEALYLHQDRGYAKAGINLMDVDGHFTFEYPDRTHYEFTSLYDVMNHGYGDVNETAARCLSQQSELQASLQQMHTYDNKSVDSARLDLASALYQQNMPLYGNMVTAGEISEELFDRILSINPLLSDEVEKYRAAANSNANEYVGFEKTVQGADQLLGIDSSQPNNYADLINNRRNLVYMYNNYKVNGIRYTDQAQIRQPVEEEQYVAQQTTQQTIQHQVARQDEKREVISEETSHTRTQVSEQELTSEEKEQAQQQIEQIEAQTETTVFIENPDYEEEVAQVIAQGEEKRQDIEETIEHHNEEAERQSQAEKDREAQEQAEALARQQELIRQSMEAEQAEREIFGEDVQPTVQEEAQQQTTIEQGQHAGEVDQTDTDRVDTEAGEEPYIASRSDVRNELEVLRAAALELDVDTDDLGLDQQGPTLS